MSVQEAKWVVKVFISSTFNDMHDERDVLMKKVLKSNSRGVWVCFC